MSHGADLEDIPPPSPETAEQKQARIRWWKEARFGMFIHYGLYSGMEGDLNGDNIAPAEWFMKQTEMDAITYKNLVLPKFKPSADCTEKWVQLAKQAGAEYIVLTSKHHEGFDLFNSKYTDFTSQKLVGRDICQEFADSCRKHGLKFGFYHSLPDWQHPDFDFTKTTGTAMQYPQGEIERNGGRSRDHKKYIGFLHKQVDELLDNYGDFDLMWFDFSVPPLEGEKAWRARELMDKIRAKAKNPNIMINNRLYRRKGAGGVLSPDEGMEFDDRYGDFMTPEQFVPTTGLPGIDWEVALTLNHNWGYNKHDKDYKTSKQLIQTLCEIVSKGGNLLLNIGPKGDGSVDELALDRMTCIGKWLQVHDEAIKGGRQSPYAEEFEWGRVISKPGVLYLCLFNPMKTISIPCDNFKTVAILGTKKSLAAKIENGRLIIYFEELKEWPIGPVMVIKVELL